MGVEEGTKKDPRTLRCHEDASFHLVFIDFEDHRGPRHSPKEYNRTTHTPLTESSPIGPTLSAQSPVMQGCLAIGDCSTITTVVDRSRTRHIHRHGNVTPSSKGEIDRLKRGHDDTQRRKPTTHCHLRDQIQSTPAALSGPHQGPREFSKRHLRHRRVWVPCPAVSLMVDGRSLTYRTRPTSVTTAALFSFGKYIPKTQGRQQ